jgi:hypothetical protein
MKLIAKIPYNEVKFRWVSNHWDLHLEGTCTYNGKLHRFTTEEPDYDEELDEWETPYSEIFELTLFEKLKWLKTQWLFEQCVGYHWTYPMRKEGKYFYYRKPQWLYKKIFNFYYKLK